MVSTRLYVDFFQSSSSLHNLWTVGGSINERMSVGRVIGRQIRDDQSLAVAARGLIYDVVNWRR